MSLYVSIELLPFEENFLLRFEIPHDEVAVLRCRDDPAVVGRPLKVGDCFLVALNESSRILSIRLPVSLVDGVEQLVLLFQNLVLQSLLDPVVVFGDDVDVSGRVGLEVVEKLVVGFGLFAEVSDQFLSHA